MTERLNWTELNWRDSLDNKQRVEEYCVRQVLEVHYCIYLKNTGKILNILVHNAFFTIWVYRDLLLWNRKIKEHFVLFVLMDLWILSLLFFFFSFSVLISRKQKSISQPTCSKFRKSLQKKGRRFIVDCMSLVDYSLKRTYTIGSTAEAASHRRLSSENSGHTDPTYCVTECIVWFSLSPS